MQPQSGDGSTPASPPPGNALLPAGLSTDPSVPRDNSPAIATPEPILQRGAGGEGMKVKPDLLAPAGAAALVFSHDAKAIAVAVGQGPPPGTPGFMTGFQIGALNDAWAREIDSLATHLQNVSNTIYRTRTRYYETESAISGSFASGG